MIRKILISILLGSKVHADSSCESSHEVQQTEGNIGQVGGFPWLGVLRVHLHDGKSMKVALSGIVLVKEGYALANAHDVIRIPKRILIEDSTAMFIPSDNTPWHCRLKDYIIHPECEYSTVNTVAILELHPPDDGYYPMRPICWPPRGFNTSTNIYVVGYTDENMLLEKLMHEVQPVRHELCEEFYTRPGLEQGLQTPVYYECVFAQNNKNNCEWDTGMVLVSNTTSYWTLVGLGVRGPGCAAPARFISLTEYLPWVTSITDIRDMDVRRMMGSEPRIPKISNTPQYIKKPSKDIYR